MKADMGSYQMFDPQRKELRLLAWKGFHPESAVFWQVVSPEANTVCEIACESRERVIVSGVKTSDFLKDGTSMKHFDLSRISAVQSTPLLSRDGKLVGMISTHWHEQHPLRNQNCKCSMSWHAKPLIYWSAKNVKRLLRKSETQRK